MIKVNDSVSVRFGVLLQPWFDESQDPVSGNYAQNLFLRRARVLIVEVQNISGSSAPASQHRYQVGLAYFVAGQNLTLKGAYGQVRPRTGVNTNQFTAQMQCFYF